MTSIKLWQNEYDSIRRQLQISMHQDLKSSIILYLLYNSKQKLEDIKNKINDYEAIVIGTGGDLEKDIKSLKRNDKKQIIIAADGALGALLRENIIPDLCISDLDSRESDLILANQLKIPIIVHSHGDNIDKIYRIVPKLKSPIMATSQVKQIGSIKLYFGFTDGDRAIFFAEHLGATNIKKLGMNFRYRTSKFSKPYFKKTRKISSRKKIKLKIAKKLIEKYKK